MFPNEVDPRGFKRVTATKTGRHANYVKNVEPRLTNYGNAILNVETISLDQDVHLFN